MTKIKIEAELTAHQIEELKELFDKIIDSNLINEMSYSSFLALEEVIIAANEGKIKADIKAKQPPSDTSECKGACKHQARYHSVKLVTSSGLVEWGCSKVDCNCMVFKEG